MILEQEQEAPGKYGMLRKRFLKEHRKGICLLYTSLPTRFLLEKQDGVTKQPLPGAKFKLTDEAGNVFSLVRQEDGTYRPALELSLIHI